MECISQIGASCLLHNFGMFVVKYSILGLKQLSDKSRFKDIWCIYDKMAKVGSQNQFQVKYTHSPSDWIEADLVDYLYLN